MFDYKRPIDYEQMYGIQKQKIANLEIENQELKVQVNDHQTNLKLNKEAIAELLATLKQEIPPEK